MEELLLGIDVGTTNCKAVLFDLDGRPRAAGRVATPCHFPRPNWAEFDAEELWRAVVAATRQALGQVAAPHVRAAAVASMGESGVLVDAGGRPLGPIIAWHDSRTIPLQRRWAEQVGAGPTFAACGLAPDPIFGAFKLMWLRDHAPAAYAAAARWLHVADYIAFRLCGAQATDYSLASRTMLFDIARRRWSGELIDRAAIRPDLLPELVPSGTLLGGVGAAAAEATGLEVGTPVASGGHDHVCAAFAAGVNAPGACLDSIGTAEAVFLPLDAPRLTEPVRQTGMAFGAHVARDRYYALDGLWTSGAAVEWAARALLPALASEEAYARMQSAAAQAPAGSLGVYFLPRLAAGDRGAFVGLTAGADTGALIRAVYEGLCYEWRRYLEAMTGALELLPTAIGATGGGTRSELWMQIKADVLGQPVRVLEVDESVALGAALLAGLAAGVFADERAATATSARVGRVVAPDAARAEFYERRYREVFLPLAAALAEVHGRIGELH